VKAQGDPMGLVSAIRNEIRGLDRALPISSIGTMEDSMATARRGHVFLTLLLTMFSTLRCAGGARNLRRDLLRGRAADQ